MTVGPEAGAGGARASRSRTRCRRRSTARPTRTSASTGTTTAVDVDEAALAGLRGRTRAGVGRPVADDAAQAGRAAAARRRSTTWPRSSGPPTPSSFDGRAGAAANTDVPGMVAALAEARGRARPTRRRSSAAGATACSRAGRAGRSSGCARSRPTSRRPEAADGPARRVAERLRLRSRRRAVGRCPAGPGRRAGRLHRPRGRGRRPAPRRTADARDALRRRLRPLADARWPRSGRSARGTVAVGPRPAGPSGRAPGGADDRPAGPGGCPARARCRS